MTQIWLLLSLALGALLISGTSGAVTKEFLLQRLSEINLAKENMMKNLTEHGLDHFADELDKRINTKELYLKGVGAQFKPEEYDGLNKTLNSVESSLNYPVTGTGSTKGTAVYLAVIVNATGSLDSRTSLKNDLIDFISLQNQYNDLKMCQKETEKEAIDIKKKADETWLWIGRKLDSMALRSSDFFELENRVIKDIGMKKITGFSEEVEKRQKLLDGFLAINVQLNRMYPLESHVRVNQFHKVAQEHYRQYTVLKAVVDRDEKSRT